MNNQKMGQFILEMRKSKQMTQKELAARLNITDKAVSKWERGLSFPDISLLTELAEVLGVTTGELLNGEKANPDTENTEADIDYALEYANKTVKSRLKCWQVIGFIGFSAILVIGIAVCGICDMAISGAFTWSLFPVSAIIFTWLVFFPVVLWGKKGIPGTLAALSLLIIPFLYVLSILVKGDNLIFPIGVRMSVIAIVYLWCVFVLFQILKNRKRLAVAVSLLLAVPVYFLIQITLSKIISQPPINVWDALSLLIIIIAAAVLFTVDLVLKEKL